MSVTSNNHSNDDFREDIPALLAGQLSQSRAREILAAAERDPELARLLAQEKSLDQLLNCYETPDAPEGLRGRFWARFHEEKLLGSTGMADAVRANRLWLKLAGPIAAALVITLGLVFWPRNPAPPAPNDTTVADNLRDDDDPVYDDDDFVRSVLGASREDAPPLNGELLKRLKLLDDARLQPLDGLHQPDDLKLLDQLELLTELDENEEGP